MRRIATFSATLCLLASLAHAQSQRTFVASTGSDANPCNRALPCRNFAAAIAATASGGEVIVLDSAGYGAVTISQSVSIIAPAGVYAGITGFSGSAVLINAPAATVTLRGLFLNGQGGANGIEADSVDALHIENSVVSRFTSTGIYDVAAGNAFVNDTIARDNGQYGVSFISLGSLTASVDHCRFENNSSYGLAISGSGGSVTVRDSVAARSTYGFYVGSAAMQLKNCSIVGNGSGVYVNGSSATLTIGGSILTANGAGLYNNLNLGTMSTFGDNEFVGNGADNSGTLGTVVPK